MSDAKGTETQTHKQAKNDTFESLIRKRLFPIYRFKLKMFSIWETSAISFSRFFVFF